MIVDAHFHCWQLARGDYGWLTPALGAIFRDVRVADWHRQAAPCGVVGGMLIQAAPTRAETEFLLMQAKSNPAVLGVVGWEDLLASDAARRVRVLAQEPLLRGLRPMLQDIPDERWIVQPALAPALEEMAGCGLVFDALIKTVHLPHVLEIARRHPSLRIVLDHAAKPDIANGEWQVWATGIERIAGETSAMCKLSGLFTEAAQPLRGGAVRPWAEHVLRCFGPQRVVWGSDWPVLELTSNYAAWWEETQFLLAALTTFERSAILGGNAMSLYGRVS